MIRNIHRYKHKKNELGKNEDLGQECKDKSLETVEFRTEDLGKEAQKRRFRKGDLEKKIQVQKCQENRENGGLEEMIIY